MARKQSTKSLKAKTTRRSAKRKPKARDIATELLTEQRALHSSMESLDKKKRASLAEGRKGDAGNYENLHTAVWHRSAIGCDEFSFAKVKTASAAAFAVVLAYSTLVTLDNIADTDFRERRRQRGQRLLHQALDYLRDKNPEAAEWDDLFHEYMPRWSDPNYLLRISRNYID
jgi:hypothetical protein